MSWIQKQFRPAIVGAAQATLGPSARVRFEVDARVALASSASPDATPRSESKETAAPPATQAMHVLQPGASHATNAAPAPRSGRRFLDLCDFVAGISNEIALTAAMQVAQAPGQKVNPLYIYGPVGTGKTHLLEGIYRQTRRNFPALQVVYLTAEAFANYFTQALREHSLPGFRTRFRTVDVLIVDDIDFLDGKKGIQEEFLHTFKQLESLGRQIVVAGDRHPRLFAKSSEELKTRFLSGLVCRVEAPDAETRERLLPSESANTIVPSGPQLPP